MDDGMMEPMTGMRYGKKRTRRGRRKGKGLPAHEQHMNDARGCVACGDLKGAKAALFRAANALGVEDEVAEAVAEAPAITAVPVPAMLSPALRAYLARKK